MSRSIGDLCAESVGVINVPGISEFNQLELYEFEITRSDKFVVVASDGLWEFLSNKEIMDLVIPFWKQDNAEGACDCLVKEAVGKWKKVNSILTVLERRSCR
jgi:serine/threonine protein phosphatase PrpC